MTAIFPKDLQLQLELMLLAREIPAEKIDILATRYLDIYDSQLTQINIDSKDNSIQTNFKCLQHWYLNTEEPNKRQALQDKLSKAVKEGLVSQKIADLLSEATPLMSLELLDYSEFDIQDLTALSKANAAGYLPELKHLTLSRNRLLSGKLGELFNEATRWRLLEMLDCSDCNLDVVDLETLSEANVKGYLPNLKHLRLGNNHHIGGYLDVLFDRKTPWKSLEVLDFSDCDLHEPDLVSLSEANAHGDLPALKHLDLNNTSLDGCLDMLLIVPRAFASLEMLTLRRLTDSDADSLLQALDEGRFPKLHTVQYYDKMTLPESTKWAERLLKYVQLEQLGDHSTRLIEGNFYCNIL